MDEDGSIRFLRNLRISTRRYIPQHRNIQMAIVNLNSNKSIGLRRREGLRSLCEEGTEFLYIIYMNFKLHQPRHDSGS